MAAHLLRAELVLADPLVIWNDQWFGGHHTPSYSALFPRVAAPTGVRIGGAASVLAAVVLFEHLAHRRLGPCGTLGALWFGAAAPGMLVMGQLPFALGVALGLSALLALDRRPWAAAALGVATALASPLAAAFLALCSIAWALAERRAHGAFGVALSALATTAVLVLAFPEGGTQSFSPRATVLTVVIGSAGLLVLPRGWRPGILLYGACVGAAALIATPVGSNATRLAFWFGGPLLVCGVMSRAAWRYRVALAVGVVAAAAWQWQEVERAAGGLESPSSRTAFYEPLLRFLEHERRRDTGTPWRVEIPMTAVKWEAFAVARRFPIARGWYRQLDRRYNSIFYDNGLTHARYAAWLEDNAVRFVALPRAPLDRSAVQERRLVAVRPSYLRERWSSRDWRIFETIPRPSVVRSRGNARMEAVTLGPQCVALRVRRPGTATVKVRWSPYWHVRRGCVEQDGEWTRVLLHRPGTVQMRIRWSLDRLVSHGRRCG